MTQTFRLLCVASIAVHAGFMSANAQEVNVEMTVLADQIRSQGFDCNNPVSAERVAAEFVPDVPVYVLKCDNANYKVRLVPDQAAEVSRIE